MARLHRRYKHRRRRKSEDKPTPRRNPPLLSDLAEWAIPGFAGFAATRFVTRVAATQIAQRKPSWGKHAGVGASIGAFLVAWFLGHRLKLIAKYHTPVTVGAAIAAAQSIIQLYFPKLGWMLADASPELAAAQSPQTNLMPAAMQLQPAHEDPNEYTYNDTFDPGRYGKGAQPGQSPPIMGPSGQQHEMSDLAIDDAIGQSSNLGVFNN